MKRKKETKQNRGRRAGFGLRCVLFPLCCLFAGAVWLAPFQYAWEYAVPLLGFIATLLFADFIRQPAAAGAAVAAATLGLCFYDPRYTACFAPFAAVYLLMRYVLREEKVKTLKSDVFFFVGRVAAAAFAVAGFAVAFSQYRKQWDDPFVFHREYAFLLLFIAAYLFYTFSGRKSAANGETVKKKRYICLLGICCMPAVFLFISACDPYVKLSSLPAFLVCAATLLSAPEKFAGTRPAEKGGA
jgi:hypothetical protein